LTNLGNRLSRVGRHRDALAPAEEAVTLYRRLAEANPAAHLPYLAASLNSLGNHLSEVGRRQDALAKAEEAVTLYRRLAETNPAAHLPDLAMSLAARAMTLRGVDGKRAVSSMEEAVEVWGRLAQQLPAAYGPWLARGRTSLVGLLDDVGRTAEAAKLRRLLT
jgi:tetratricopeptide (TPR) repeat protein